MYLVHIFHSQPHTCIGYRNIILMWCNAYSMHTWSKPSPTHFGGANADGSGKFDGNGFTNAPPPLNGLPVVFACDTAGCRKWGGKPCNKWAP